MSPREEFESGLAIGRADSVVIRYGIEIPPVNPDQPRLSEHAVRLLYLGRLHPIKGIENLLRALTLTKQKVVLDVCGQGSELYEAQLRSLTIQAGLAERVWFHGSVCGEAKEKHFQEADLCIVPSFTEGFATVIAEALARGVPVIASRGTPWQRIEEIGCGLYVDNAPEELARAIDRAATMPLTEMGLRGRAWMERDFSWTHVANEMVGQYRDLIDNHKRESLEVITSPKAA